MLNDATCFKDVYIVCGYTDLRKGIDSLAATVCILMDKEHFYVPNTLFLFCGRRRNKIKGLVWEEDGYLMLYKRLSDGYFQWPRNEEDVKHLTQEQFMNFMDGLAVEPKKTIRKIKPEYIA